MIRFPPVYPRNDGWVREVKDIEAGIVCAKGKSSPYLDDSIVETRCNHQCRVGRELREFNGAGEFLFPDESRGVV